MRDCLHNCQNHLSLTRNLESSKTGMVNLKMEYGYQSSSWIRQLELLMLDLAEVEISSHQTRCISPQLRVPWHQHSQMNSSPIRMQLIVNLR
jgi:hypothetical protein